MTLLPCSEKERKKEEENKLKTIREKLKTRLMLSIDIPNRTQRPT